MAAGVQSGAALAGPLYIAANTNPRSGSCTGQISEGCNESVQLASGRKCPPFQGLSGLMPRKISKEFADRTNGVPRCFLGPIPSFYHILPGRRFIAQA
jgi:hypothetical protein